MKKGKLIVIDGTDGSGKKTQSDLLLEKLLLKDYDVQTKDFPQYGKKSAGPVEEYLNGKFGAFEDVGPYRASILFAVDRYDAGFETRRWLDQGKIVLCNRYVTANMAHQGSQIKNDQDRENYFAWLKDLEYNIFGIPQPDINLFLHVPPEVAMELIDKKGHRDYIGGHKKDLLEADLQHQRDTEKLYLRLAEILPNSYLIECAPGEKLLTPEEIHELIWEKVKRLI